MRVAVLNRLIGLATLQAARAARAAELTVCDLNDDQLASLPSSGPPGRFNTGGLTRQAIETLAPPVHAVLVGMGVRR